MSEDSRPVVRKAECSECRGIRNCDIKGEHSTSYNEHTFWGRTTWYILQCRGCDHVFCQQVKVNSENIDQHYDEDGQEIEEYIEQHEYWPALTSRSLPSWIPELDDKLPGMDDLTTALQEVYAALDRDSRILPMTGTRIAFDIAATLLEVDGDLTFTEKLDNLVGKGLLGTVDVDRMHTLIEAGNASTHRGWRPTKENLNIVVDILEHFLERAFIDPAKIKKLDKKASVMRGKVPAREKKTRNKPKPD